MPVGTLWTFDRDRLGSIGQQLYTAEILRTTSNAKPGSKNARFDAPPSIDRAQFEGGGELYRCGDAWKFQSSRQDCDAGQAARRSGRLGPPGAAAVTGVIKNS